MSDGATIDEPERVHYSGPMAKQRIPESRRSAVPQNRSARLRRQSGVMVRRAVLVLMALNLVTCVSTSSTRVEAPTTAPAGTLADCPAPLEPYVKVTLYMGRGTQDAGAWQEFVDGVLVRHFPDGGTMLETSGWWEGRVGDAADKNSRMLVMLHPAADRDDFAQGVQAVIADIKERFDHRAVLWEEAAICATLSS